MAYKFRVGDLVYHNTLSPGGVGTYTNGEILELGGTDAHPTYRLKWHAHGTAIDPEHVLEFMPGTEPTAEPSATPTSGFTPGQLVRVAPGHCYTFFSRSNGPELAFYQRTESNDSRWLQLAFCNGQELRVEPSLVTPASFAGTGGPGDLFTIEELQDQIQDLQRALALAHEALKAAANRS